LRRKTNFASKRQLNFPQANGMKAFLRKYEKCYWRSQANVV